MSSGGGVSGKIGFPLYVEGIHESWMVGTGDATDLSITSGNIAVQDLVENALDSGGDPYESYAFTDPSSDFDEMSLAVSDFSGSVGTLEEVSDWKSLVAEAVAKVDEAGVLRDLGVDDLSNSAALGGSVGVQRMAGQIGKGQIAGLLPVGPEEWKTFIQDVAMELKSCAVRKDINMAQILQESIYAASDAVEEALTQAAALTNSQMFTDLVDAYSAQAETERGRSVRSFTGPMADINAVNSSAFMFGLSIIYSQTQLDVDQFSAQARLDIHNALVSAHMQAHQTGVQTGVQAAVANKSSHDQLLAQGIQGMITLRTTKIQYEQAILQLLNNVFSTELDMRIRGEAVNKQTRDQVMVGGVASMTGLKQLRYGLEQSVTGLIAETNRMQIAGRRDYEVDELGLEEKSALWPFTALREGANILAAPAGMTATLPEKQGQLGSAIGGGLSGVAMGAQIGTAIAPGLGTGIGAGIGGIIGAIAGATE